MAKTNTIQIKLVSSADTGFFYVTKKNARTMTEKQPGTRSIGRVQIDTRRPRRGLHLERSHPRMLTALEPSAHHAEPPATQY